MHIQGFSSVLVNTLTVLIGSSIGLLLKKGIPERISKAVMIALGLVTMYIGISGALSDGNKGANAIVVVIVMVVGTIIGEIIDIDKWIGKAGEFVEKKSKKKNNGTSIAEGFVTSSLVFCIGAMTIVGSLEAGLKGDCTTIYTKSIMDLISSCMMASAMGFGVLCSSLFVFIFQGSLVLLSGLLENVLRDPNVIAEISIAGNIMILGLGFNLIGLSKFKIANMLPALLLVPLVHWGISYIPFLS